MTEVFMPKAGMDMKEGRLIRWLKNVGDQVELDEPIMEIETDKITMESEAPATGILLAKLVDDNTTVPVLQTIGYIGQPGEKIPDGPVATEAKPTVVPAVPASPTTIETMTPSTTSNGLVLATPYARKLAKEKGIDLFTVPNSGFIHGRDVLAAESLTSTKVTPLAKKYGEINGVSMDNVTGTGYGGKTTKKDVLASMKPAVGSREPVHIPLTPIRKAIARNMLGSLNTMAQTSDSVELDVTELVNLRKRLAAHQEQLGIKITINDLLSYAAVKMIKTHPLANASFGDTEIISYPNVNLSMAIATDYGLTSPVVHDADLLSLMDLSKALHNITIRARERRLTMDDQIGGTFTLTNMGIFPVDNFNPILPSPQSCILGFGRCREKPAVYEGQICIRIMMVLSVTYDHRVFDGGEVGSIMKTMKEYLENPELFLVQ
jgi:pyruvate dehydrogenase E2 component (dihydrolipoamide acetyltransferase)